MADVKIAVVSEYIKVPTTKPEKVTNLVGTFLPDDIDGMRIIRVTTKDVILF